MTVDPLHVDGVKILINSSVITGYMINNLCYPGDAFTNPNMPIDILALPVAGPWMRIKDAINYALTLKP